MYFYGFDNINGVKNFIDIQDQAGRGDTVVSVFVAIKDFFTDWATATGITGNMSNNVNFSYSKTVEITKVNYLADEYYPTNKNY